MGALRGRQSPELIRPWASELRANLGTTWDCPLSVELPSHLTPPPPLVALGACWAWPEARNRPRAAEAEAELTARRAAPGLGFSALLAFHARQCAVTPLFAAGAAPQALKKTPRSHGPHMY